jgi:putative addiction module component (TIGR02574 family)
MKIAEIEKEVLHLPASERARIAQKLLISLENLSQPELDQLWLDEAERRAADIDQGKVQLVSADEVSRKARTLLK